MAAPTVHGSLYSNSTSFSSSLAVSGVTTTVSNVQLFVFLTTGQGDFFTSVSGGGLTWTELDNAFFSAAANARTQIWTARASSTITSQTITASRSSSNASKMWLIMFEGCTDYTSLVKNTDYACQKTETDEDTGEVAVSLTTKAADSLIYGVYTSWSNTATLTASSNTTKVDEANTNDTNGALVRRTDNPLAVGTYSIGITNSTTGNWRGTIIHGIEILGTGGGGGGLSIPVAMNHLRNQGIS